MVAYKDSRTTTYYSPSNFHDKQKFEFYDGVNIDSVILLHRFMENRPNEIN